MRKILPKLHPLSHLTLCLILSSMVFSVAQPVKLIAYAAIAFTYAAIMISSGMGGALKTLLRSLPLLLSIALVQLIFRRQGEIILEWSFVTIHREGFDLAIVLIFRLLTVIYAAKILASLSFQDFSMAFACLRLPEELSFMISYAVHLIPQFLGQLKSFVTNLRLRGINPGKVTLRKGLEIYKLLAVSAVANLVKNSDASAIALELRGFRSSGKRSFLHLRRLNLLDIASIILGTAFSIWLAAI